MKVRQAEADSGARPELLSSHEREEIRRLRRENYELRRANEILKSASVFFAKELDPDRCSLSVPGLSASRAVDGLAVRVPGGACARLVVWVGCARTPSLISVRDPGWLRVGDMMGDGVFRWGDAVRPLCL